MIRRFAGAVTLGALLLAPASAGAQTSPYVRTPSVPGTPNRPPLLVGADGRFSIDVHTVDLYDVLRLIAAAANQNVVPDNSVPHLPITLRLDNTTFDSALDTLARAYDLGTQRFGTTIIISSTSSLMRGSPAGVPTQPSKTSVLALRYAAPDVVQRALLDALPPGSIVFADVRTRSLILTAPASTTQRAREIVNALDRPSVGDDNALHSATIPLRYLSSQQALEQLNLAYQLQRPATAVSSPTSNALYVTAPADVLEQVRHTIDALDQPGQQVLFSVQVADVTPQNDSSEVGVLFGGVNLQGQQQAGNYGTATTFLNRSLQINATINALVSRGTASILAKPRVTTLNNVKATLLVGTSYPVVYYDGRTGTQNVQFVNAGVNLEVTPTIGSDGVVTSALNTSYSQILGTQQGYPIIGTRTVQSTMRVHDGESIVLAGLFSDITSETVKKLPLLGDIPVFGQVFRDRAASRNKDEIVFIITPHILKPGETPEQLTPDLPDTRKAPPAAR